MHEAIGFGSVMLRSAFDVNPTFQDASLRAGVRFDLFSIEATGFVQSNSDLLVNRLGTRCHTGRRGVLAGVQQINRSIFEYRFSRSLKARSLGSN